MHPSPFVPIKHSIATQLLKVVFGMYLLLVLTLTVIHLTTEFTYTRAEVLNEVRSLEMMIRPGLEQALWEMNVTQTRSIMEGLVQLPIILGVRIENHEHHIVGQIGHILTADGNALQIDQDGVRSAKSTASGLFWHAFPLTFMRGDQVFPVGMVTLYSGSSVIFARIRFGFLLLLTNAVLQIVAFWGLFLWISRKMLSRPLTELTQATEQVHLGNLEEVTINVHASEHNELKRLETAFNRMIRNLLSARKELQHVHDEHRQKLELEVEQRTQELKIAKEEAEVANQAKSTFLANMSHELRTPLNVILGFAQVMARTPHTPEEQEHLDTIRRSGNHLLTLINQVLDLSKIEAGHLAVETRKVDLYAMLAELEDMFRLRAHKKHLQFSCECASIVPRILRTDEIKLRQILINLLGNAFKFTEQGSVTLNIVDVGFGIVDLPNQVEYARPQQSKISHLKFQISDSGPGIAPEDLERVFEVFGQASAGQRHPGGSGLGLAISRRFARLLGGDMTVESTVGAGTTFTLSLPVETVEETENHHRAAPRRPVGLEPGQRRFRILIADDEPDNRKLLVALLTPFTIEGDSGFEIREAADGQETVDLWRDWNPHLIFMDIRMPLIDGNTATRTIRTHDTRHTTHDTPTRIVAMTASTFEENRQEILEAGCDAYLRKPFLDTEIFDQLREHLGVRFVYADQHTPEAAAAPCEEPQEDLQAAISALPPELAATLKQAATFCDMMEITAMLPEIRRYSPPLADAVAGLVDEFDYNAIVELFEHSPQKGSNE